MRFRGAKRGPTEDHADRRELSRVCKANFKGIRRETRRETCREARRDHRLSGGEYLERKRGGHAEGVSSQREAAGPLESLSASDSFRSQDAFLGLGDNRYLAPRDRFGRACAVALGRDGKRRMKLRAAKRGLTEDHADRRELSRVCKAIFRETRREMRRDARKEARKDARKEAFGGLPSSVAGE